MKKAALIFISLLVLFIVYMNIYNSDEIYVILKVRQIKKPVNIFIKSINNEKTDNSDEYFFSDSFLNIIKKYYLTRMH